jgi:hypothetical protein
MLVKQDAGLSRLSGRKGLHDDLMFPAPHIDTGTVAAGTDQQDAPQGVLLAIDRMSQSDPIGMTTDDW